MVRPVFEALTDIFLLDKRPAIAKYHWSLNSVRSGRILGSPGKSMSVIGGIKLHNGIATLNDGLDRGYLDAGDYQGECISGRCNVSCMEHFSIHRLGISGCILISDDVYTS